MSSQSPYLMRAMDMTARMQSFSHPWNSLSEIYGTMMDRPLGLKHMGVSFVRVPPDRESFVCHSYQRGEERIYIPSGEAQAEIDDNIFTVYSGSFMAFPTGVAHHLRNCGKDGLVYLYGGEHLNIEIADSPRLGRCMLRRGEQMDIVDIHPQWELTSFGAQGEDCTNYARQRTHYNATHDPSRRPPIPDYPDPERLPFDHCGDTDRPPGCVRVHHVL